MDVMDTLLALVRWIHVFGGIIWIGFLFFFGFIFSPTVAGLSPDIRGPVYGAVTGRLFRWIRPTTGIAYLTGLILLGMVFHAGGLMFENGSGWGAMSGIAAILPFLLFLPYDMAARTKLGSNMPVMGAALVIISVGYLYFMLDVAGMTYRASMIHIGAAYGTIIAANVFMRVLPIQKKILAAMSEKRAPDPADMAAVQARAKHNIYVAIPLVWAMLDQHTVVPGASSPLVFLAVLLVSIAFVGYLYRQPKPAD